MIQPKNYNCASRIQTQSVMNQNKLGHGIILTKLIPNNDQSNILGESKTKNKPHMERGKCLKTCKWSNQKGFNKNDEVKHGNNPRTAKKKRTKKGHPGMNNRKFSAAHSVAAVHIAVQNHHQAYQCYFHFNHILMSHFLLCYVTIF